MRMFGAWLNRHQVYNVDNSNFDVGEILAKQSPALMQSKVAGNTEKNGKTGFIDPEIYNLKTENEGETFNRVRLSGEGVRRTDEGERRGQRSLEIIRVGIIRLPSRSPPISLAASCAKT